MVRLAWPKASGTVIELVKSGSALTASMRKSFSPLRTHSLLGTIGFSGEGLSGILEASETRLLSEVEVLSPDESFAGLLGAAAQRTLFNSGRRTRFTSVC